MEDIIWKIKNGQAVITGDIHTVWEVLHKLFPNDNYEFSQYCKLYHTQSKYFFANKINGNQWRCGNIENRDIVQAEEIFAYLTSLPKRGDIVLVSDDKDAWTHKIFLAYIHNCTHPFVCVSSGDEDLFNQNNYFDISCWKYWKTIPKVKEFTVEECAKALGVSVEEFRLKK